ncbi:sulfite oxidase [Photobacterium makurazakiensis]|uniref:sulfite oxidase n=1 Tax=Photobacterium makurazakiensis TaxID=2910234 RepID=UPI003D144776
MTNKNNHKGIHELYRENPINADKKVFGRTSDPISRRGFLTGLGTMSAILGAEVVFGRFMPAGMIPAAFAETTEQFALTGKHSGLIVLNDRPINAEVPAHLLNDWITPADKLFVRNNGLPPETVDPKSWTLTIDGESAKQSKTFTIQELKDKFEHHTYQLTIECGGNGRAEFNPPAKGNQWTTGAVGSPQWTGVRLRDVLEDCGIKDDAVYIGYHAADSHLTRDPAKTPISRGVPINKALEDEALIAWEMNGEAIPMLNGAPLRLVFGGWPASTSGKWLTGISIRNKVHDGTKMGAPAYRVPCSPVAPGEKVDKENMCIIEQMPVKSLVTYPKSGERHNMKDKFIAKGHAWAGDKSVKVMHVSIDFGQTWQEVEITKPVNKNAWQHWEAELTFPKKGYYEVWSKATDSDDISQPMILPGWNPKGYLNNACHRIAVQVV